MRNVAVILLALLLPCAYLLGYVAANTETRRCIDSLGTEPACRANAVTAPLLMFWGR